eukprot:8489594-Karenia_brevis.AAC.1
MAREAANHNCRWKIGDEFLTVDEVTRLCAIRRWGFGTPCRGRLNRDGVFEDVGAPEQEYEYIAKW